MGCGTGAVTLDIANLTDGEVIGIDIDTEKLQEAQRVLAEIPNIKIMEADAADLPFDDETFDVVVFNIVMMHIKGQQKAVTEMVRVIKPCGFLLATLEPDYTGKIEYPEDPALPLILKNLEEIGADLSAGRKLKFLFTNAGLKTEIGIDTKSEFIFHQDDKKRLEMFKKDFWILEKVLKKNKWPEKEIEKYKQETEERIKKGLSLSFIPCFYAIGKKIR